MNNWIKLSDRLPEDGQTIIAYDNSDNDNSDNYSFHRDGHIVVVGEYDLIENCIYYVEETRGYSDMEFTHWMPLPEAPEED